MGAGTLGIVEATVGVGAAIGAAIAIRWRPRRDAFLGFIVLLPQGAAIGVLGLPHLAAVVCAAVVIGTAPAVLRSCSPGRSNAVSTRHTSGGRRR